MSLLIFAQKKRTIVTLVQLEYIIALDTHRHFAVAAQHCFVTQPTLSMQIQKLEDSLGVTLFDRDKHPVEPTPIGKKIIEQARNILSESKKIKDIIDDEKHEIRGEIKIGVIPSLSPYLVPLFVSSFVEKYPRVNLQITELISENVIKSLKNDQIDVGLLVTPLNEEGLLEHPLFYEEFYVYTSHHHELYNEKSVDPKNLKTEGLWILNEGHCFRNQTLNICNIKDPSRYSNRVVYDSGSLEALKKLVDRHGGFTLLPELVTFDLNRDDKSKVRKFAQPVPVREVSLVVRKSFLKQKLIEAIHAEIMNSLPPIMTSRKNANIVSMT